MQINISITKQTLYKKVQQKAKINNFQNLLLSQEVQQIIEKAKSSSKKMTTNSKQNNFQQWLQSINCIQFFTQNDILNGMLIYNIINHISTSQSPSLKELSTSTSTLSRVTNWNILSEELKKFSINLTQEQRNKIINGNQEAVIEIVSHLKEFHSKKEKSSEVDLSQVDPKKDPNDSTSLLELLLVLMVKNFHLSTKQAVALLSNQSKYLAHILTKGLKGQFKGIQNFLTEMSKSLQKITQFCKSNQQNVIFFLRSIKPALISKSQQVSSICLQFFNKFLLHYNNDERLMIFETHLLTTYILTIKRHPHMQVEVIVSMLDTIVERTIDINSNNSKEKHLKGNNNNTNKNKIVSKDHDSNSINLMRTKVLEHLWNALSSETEKYSMTLTIFNTFGQHVKIQELLSIEFFSKKIKKSIEAIKEQQHSLTCVDIVLLINQYMPDIFNQDQLEEIQQKFHLNSRELAQILVQNLHSLQFPSHPIPLSIQIFTLLHNFGQEKHFIAPALYKILIQKFSQVQDINSDLYQVYLQNFVETIKEFPSIPWNKVFEIIMSRKKQASQGVEINEIQIEFFYFLLGLENIDIKTALVIFDVVSKAFIETYHLAGHITKLIVKVVDLFAKTQAIVQELTVKLIKVCLAIHHANTKKLSHKRKSLTGNTKLNDQEALAKIKNHSIQILILKLCHLKIDEINSKVEPLVAFSYIQMKEKSEYVKGFKNILTVLGNFNQIVEKYEKQIKKVEQEAKQQQKFQKQKLEKEKQRMSASKIVSKVHSKNRYDIQNIESARQNQSLTDENPNHYIPQNKGQSISLHNNSFNRSYLGITPSAQKGIEKFQKVYLTKIERQDFEKIRKQQEEQRFEMMKKLYRKKMMSHGIQIKGQTDNIQYLYEFDSQENHIFEKHFLKVPYYTIQTEEDRDMMAVEKLLKSYQKSLKFIFSLYSGQKRGQIPQNFDEIAEKNVFINSSNLYKFLKDFGFEDYITLKEVQYLTQKINVELNPQTVDYQLLEQDGFIEFIKQVSFLMFTRPPKDLRGHPLTMMLEETFSNLKIFAAQNKINQQIFEDPAIIFFNETEAVAELNKKLAKNPDYILPEGYKKIVQKKITFEYGVFLEALSPTYKVVFEMVDWLLNKALDVHVIEPFTKQEKVTKARPALFVAERLKIDSIPAKHIPISLKKQIIKIPIKSRTEAKQCAIVLDQIITAIELGHTTIGQKYMNKLQIEKKKQSQEEMKQLEIQKRRRENRNRYAKTAIQQYNQKKQQKQKEVSQKKLQEEKKLKEEKQRKEKEEKQLKQKIEEYNKKKKQEEEQKIRKKKQQEEKEKKEREKFKQLNDQTKKKIQEEKKKKEEEQNAKKIEKQKQEKKIKELEKKKLQQSQIIKKKMVEEFKLRKSQVRDTNSVSKLFTEEKKNLESLEQKQ